MNMESFKSGDEVEAQPLDRLSFDLLRALLEARQGASPTVRALSAARLRGGGVAAETSMALLSGRATGDQCPSQSGAFHPRKPGDAVLQDGERHV